MNKLPIVTIVGRTNVGKSSILNSVLREGVAIVAKESGTTRDKVMRQITFHTQPEEKGGESHEVAFWLADTAGLKKATDEFELTIQEQIKEATLTSDLIMVVVENGIPVTDEDRRVAQLVHRSKKPAILLINKIDKKSSIPREEYKKMGFDQIIEYSATQKIGLDDLETAILEYIKPVQVDEKKDDIIRVSLIGRPNTGKSSLFNTILKKQEAITSDLAGTTRDINQRSIISHGQEIQILDTAGIRKSSKVEQGIESFSVLRSMWAIEHSDICILTVDSSDAHIAFDQKLAGMIKDRGRGIIIALTKWDIVEKDAFTHDELVNKLKTDFEFIPYATIIATSSVTTQNASKLIELIRETHASRQLKIKTSTLNTWLRKVVSKHPPSGTKNYFPKLNYIIQEDNDIPAFRIYGANTKHIHFSYKRYLEARMREEFGFAGNPIQIWFIEKHAPKTTTFKNRQDSQN